MARLPEPSSEVVPASQSGTPAQTPKPSGSELAARGPEQVTASTRRRSVSRAALLSGRRWRMGVRWLGLAIFVVGAGLLAYVFMEALSGFQRFSQPDFLSREFNRVAGDDWPSRIQAAVVVFGSELLRVLYLLLLGYLASVIASKGIQFFSASDAIIDEAVAAGLDADMDVEAAT